MSEKAHTIRDERATAKKYELFLKSMASHFSSGTSSVQEGRRKTNKSPSHTAKKKSIINDKAVTIKTHLQHKLRVSMRHNHVHKNKAGKCDDHDHVDEASDNDSLQELDDIPTITHPRQFFVDDYKDKSILIIPTKE